MTLIAPDYDEDQGNIEAGLRFWRPEHCDGLTPCVAAQISMPAQRLLKTSPQSFSKIRAKRS
jgi:hypothetical protein